MTAWIEGEMIAFSSIKEKKLIRKAKISDQKGRAPRPVSCQVDVHETMPKSHRGARSNQLIKYSVEFQLLFRSRRLLRAISTPSRHYQNTSVIFYSNPRRGAPLW